MKASDKSYKRNTNMKKLIVLITVILSINNVVSAQECGPSCPICSGSTDGSLLATGTFLFSGISIPGGEEETGVLSFRYGAFSRIDLGAGYAFKSEEVIWNARFQALKEDEESWKPGIILGTGSVRTGKSDQSLYLHTTKSWEFSENFSLRFTAGMASLIPEFEKVYGLGGMTMSIAEKYSPFLSYDGINFHEGFAWIPLDWLAISVLLVESKEPAISIGIKHSFVSNLNNN